MAGQHAASTFPRQGTGWNDGTAQAFIVNDLTVPFITRGHPTEPTWLLL